METVSSEPLADLYEIDDTAWLEANSEPIRSGRFDEVDFSNLAEYLSAMARSERREVASRLLVLIAHLLKWRYQPDHRTRSGHGTILHQRHELEGWLESGVLRLHAAEVLAQSYVKAVRQAAVETGISESAFPTECPFSLDEVLDGPLDTNGV